MRDVMDTLRVLAPAAANTIVVLIGIAFAVVAVGCLTYAMKSGQFREIEEAKYRMLDAEEPDPMSRGEFDGKDSGQLTLTHGGRA